MKLVLLYAGAALLVAFLKGIKRNSIDERNSGSNHRLLGPARKNLKVS